MAAASSFYSPMALRYLPAPYTHRPSVSHLRANLLLPRYPFRRPVVVFSRRRNKTISAITSSNKNEQMVPRNESIKGDGVDENALDSPFSLQEEDLENDDPSLAEFESELDKDLAELEREFEDLAKLERLLDKALQALSDDEEEEEEDDDDDDDDEEKKQMMPYNEVTKEDDVDEDALQSPFTQKEEDLENDDPSLAKLELELEGDLAKLESEFEEDLAKLERELDKVLQALSDDEEEEEEEEEEDDDDNDGGEKLVMLPKNLQRLNHNEVTKEDDADPDALEALFSKLEEDLENGDPYLDDGDGEIDEKDLAKLERELVKALGDDKLLGAFDSLENDEVNKKVEDGDGDDDDDDGDNDDDDGKKLVKLKNWQLRRLAYALKNGRRKISIKNLAAELCLDRAVVLQLLRNPPASLLLMSAALPDKLISPISEPESKPLETVSSEIVADVPQPETDLVVPVHAMQSSWSARKRLKKVQVDTLQRVYARTKRPTNAMVSSIVHVTNLPRKRVVKWFEDKRTEDGVPDHRHPYQRTLY
ncbi:Protein OVEREXPRESSOR OF CATIONIC PEROXIDASE like [Actinidia chinensis var. chinensis]|uniref:Protein OVEREXPRESSOR OF CATIONIC PEROXIDASE like n=1 Tax=Actinidia chinensis var. chinensis TaxID=1590841 RepID=A0A2R6Q2N4_ACTCC|nr:Protein OVEREXPRESSOR OF CATIONIC PEROXIDASE like [Actinidia chinensis var. chinensis]